ncbi:MAG: 2Fe-2S iron-sulfur cluster binding domain-containing protein [Acetobacteraceae bacterium]|nr:2Fe-2S iron-sulfur cluster binding domain-containing protein [Acetobacteraceae bacterium]
MPRITFIQPDGAERTLDLPVGTTLMLGATQNGVRGIVAECGGCCSCATCHVYVDEDWADRLPPPESGEDEMLFGTAAERLPNSRLSCQLTVTEDMDGLVVRVPDRQV